MRNKSSDFFVNYFNKAYAFDIDDNLLHTDVDVFVEKEGFGIKKILEKELHSYLDGGRNYPNNNPDECFRNMRLDNGKLTKDLFDAFSNNKFGPSWNRFLKANVDASPIALITARGHPVKELQNAHKALIFEVLTGEQFDTFLENMSLRLGRSTKNKDYLVKHFLDTNYYAPCSNKSYSNTLGMDFNTEVPQKKVLAFGKFIEHVVALSQNQEINHTQKGLKIGFSDDSLDNIKAVQEAIQTHFINRYPDITFATYNTNNPAYVQKLITFANKSNDPDF